MRTRFSHKYTFPKRGPGEGAKDELVAESERVGGTGSVGQPEPVDGVKTEKFGWSVRCFTVRSRRFTKF